MRIGIAGVAIESSTFSPHRAGLADFDVRRGDELLARYDFLSSGWAAGVEWVPLVHARSLPGGAVVGEVYEGFAAEIVERIGSAGPLDGLFFDIHGAMSVVGRVDAEADLAARVRAALGDGVLVSTSMDLHGNVSRELGESVDLITCYRMAPHEDAMESRERTARNLVERLRSGLGKPKKAWVQVPVLLPGEKTSTRIEPAASIYRRVAEIADEPGVLDAAVWVGYAWADEPRCQAAVVVMGDDEQLIADRAYELARAYWDARADFEFVAPTGTLHACVAAGLNSTARPFLISDSGDNPTAGGAGDVSWTLRELLTIDELTTGRATAIHASITDPDAVAACVAAGVGNPVSVAAGGKVDSGPAGPVELTGTVFSLSDDPVGGTVAVVQAGGLHAILTTRRKPYHHLADFTLLGLDPAKTDLVIVKIGYLEPELYDLAADWLLALTPGGVDQDLLRLGHHNIIRPLFPFDPQMPDPDLTPELI
ncbi:M81 family metallopeptidase [Kribbella sandramycini]|uniref:M81 family metallopeptidase n=1 Tax=Kribbella sandramycini TaxID=60450 RepID=A0A7Y4L007_9ACTN|nr:M81 family metallopeptidase [Kribbella sandramycini]MBB6565522.1 microcystin degradation protein MlrC [Kribbella sandramycini]NOL41789.1 M81 family metallopeptidase [Kribbella sandramycini]